MERIFSVLDEDYVKISREFITKLQAHVNVASYSVLCEDHVARGASVGKVSVMIVKFRSKYKKVIEAERNVKVRERHEAEIKRQITIVLAVLMSGNIFAFAKQIVTCSQ